MREIYLNGKTAYVTDIVSWGDSLVCKRGFCLGEIIPFQQELVIKDNNREFLPDGLDVIDLIYYGELIKIGEVYISNWYDKYRLTDNNSFKIFYDAKRRFGGKFFSHSRQTCLPFVQQTEYEILFGLYCMDTKEIIIKESLSSICYDKNEFCLHSQNITELLKNVVS